MNELPTITKQKLEERYRKAELYFKFRVEQDTLTVDLLISYLKEVEPIFNRIIKHQPTSFSLEVGETRKHLTGLIKMWGTSAKTI